jgi:hypothetical protein
MSRCNWGRAFRNDYVEPKRISPEQQVLVNSVELKRSAGLKTWHDAFRDGKFIGMIRVKFCGALEFKLNREDEALYGGQIGHHGDPAHAQAVLRLLQRRKV